MDSSNVSALWYRRSKPLGKVKQRVQDLRIPSAHYNELKDSAPTLDLSHNEAARLAADSLLSHGLEGYHEVLSAEGEVDFLSVVEKSYILENGRDGRSVEPDASDDADKDPDTLSPSSHSSKHYRSMSTDRNPVEDPNSIKDVTVTNRGQDVYRIYLQSEGRSCAMKDSVREFIRKAETVLAIVIDSFTDVELLCDLLEASRKRNVSVHLLLDHLNLDLFVSMWQELKLESKNFPKLLVRSVDGQTYCAKTGRKLTGQIAESFIISDSTQVLTGSYSFSWLSWHVHRTMVVLVKGSMVERFDQEFHRLYSSSKPVPGFVGDNSLPCALPPHTSLLSVKDGNAAVSKSKVSNVKTMCNKALNEDAQNTDAKPKVLVLSEIQSPKLECSKRHTQPLHKGDTGTLLHEIPPQLDPKPPVQTSQSAAEGMQKHKEEAVSTLRDTLPNVEPSEKNLNKIQTECTNAQSQPNSPTSTTSAKSTVSVQESNPLHTDSTAFGHVLHRTTRYQSILATASNMQQHNVGAEGIFFQQNRDRFTKPSGGLFGGLNTQRRQWNGTLNFKPNVDFVPEIRSPPATSPLSPGSNWMPLSRQHSFNSSYRSGQNRDAQMGWRPSHNSMNPGLARSKSMVERRSVGFTGAGRNRNMSYT
ncbi:protein FAM83A-like [Labrus bergylta]|uniref:protein FAM83A-like n=1 Tax=Labrus bergylta TaxID=56723 RepID=UPI0033136F59